MFFLNQDEGEGQSSKAPKKPPVAKAGVNGNASPAKNKMAGGKVLRNKTRSAAHEELAQSMAAKIAEHQRELHAKLHQEGLARFSEGGGGTGGKEGKGWKRFQSYKGEAALPREVENLRVSRVCALFGRACANIGYRSSWTRSRKQSFFLSTATLCHSTSTRSRTSARARKGTSRSSVSTSRPQDNWRARRKIL